MTNCYCKALLAILVIVFAWVPDMGYNQIMLTIFGILILILSLKPGICCCCTKPTKKVKKK